jgi:hypothetical protein
VSKSAIQDIYVDADKRFHVFFIETTGDSVDTVLVAPMTIISQDPLIEVPDLTQKKYRVYLNGTELGPQDFALTTWDDAGTYKITLQLINRQFQPGDYVVILEGTKLTDDDIQFTENSRISAAKLNQIFDKIMARMEELQAAGFSFASATVFRKVADAIQNILSGFTDSAKAEIDNYVETSLQSTLDSKADIGHNHTITDITDIASASVSYATTSGDADTVDGQHASAFAPANHTHDGRYYTKAEVNNLLTNKANHRVAKLLIFYAYPSSINSTYDNQRAGAIFSQYDLVVFPENAEQPTHLDHYNLVEIIKYIKQYNPFTKMFGYIPTGNRAGIDKCYTVDEIYSKAQKWKDLGVHGIFLDEFGFDYNNDRTRQNDILDVVHSLGLIAFVNAWNPDDVFGGTTTIHWLNGIDWYLLESFGSVADGTNWYWVSSADVFYRAWQVKYQYSDFNINVAGVATVNTDDQAETVYKIMYVISTAYGIDAFNVAKAYYYALDVNLLNIPTLPDYAGNYKGNHEPYAETTNWTLSSGTVLTGCERRYGKSAVGDYEFVWHDATPEPVYIFLSNFFEYDKEKGSLDLFTNAGKIIKAISGNSFTEIDGGKITTGIIKGHYDTTKIDLNNDIIDVGNGLVKAGKGVLSNGGNGIRINADNLEVEGEIDTSYLKLEKSAIIDLNEYVSIISKNNVLLGSNLSQVWHQYSIPTYDILSTQSLITAKGTKQYLNNVPIKLRVRFLIDTTQDTIQAYYKLDYNGVNIYTSPTQGYAGSITFDDIFDFYSMATPATGQELSITIFYMPNSTLNDIWLQYLYIEVPKTLFIVHAI